MNQVKKVKKIGKSAKKPVTLETLALQIQDLAITTKEDIKSLRADTKSIRADMATKDDLEELAIMTKKSFDSMDESQTEIKVRLTKVEEGQEEIKYRLSERAMEYDVRDLDRRVKILEEAR